MPYMMKITRKSFLFITLFTLLLCQYSIAQSEALTSSPYSLYGLGIINQTSIGKSNALGYTGIARKTATEINNLNPANYALIPQNSFFYDIGVTGELNNYSNRAYNEKKANVNFSNLAFAFRISEGLGAGITMVPYSDVGYSLVGIQSNIEGSTETFESSVTGLGSLSDLKFNIGYSISNKIRFGLTASFLFGNIEENESFSLSTSSLSVTETTNYNGARFGLGAQFDINDKISLGSTLQFPTSLKASLDRSVTKVINSSTQIEVEADESDAASNFDLPLEIGFGLNANVFKSFSFSADYKKNFWDATDQSELAGTYSDQDIFGFGFEYIKNKESFKFADRINYRLGYNYDNGYLKVNNQKVNGYNITAGIGLPVSLHSNSIINFSYSYGSKGRIDNVLIKENYHLFTLNMSLEDLWFRQRKIN